MLPDEIKVSLQVIYRVDRAATYADYCGVKEEPEKKEVPIYKTATQHQEVLEAIGKSNILLESLFQIVKELVDSLNS